MLIILSQNVIIIISRRGSKQIVGIKMIRVGRWPIRNRTGKIQDGRLQIGDGSDDGGGGTGKA